MRVEPIPGDLPKPVLSFVTCARNDEYGGNFRWRLETAINFTASKLGWMGRLEEVEYIVVDWGSEVPLYKVLNLNDCAIRIARFIVVPPHIANQCNIDGKFAATLAINTGVRRSRGKFIAHTNGDVLYDENILSKLLHDVCDTEFASVPDCKKVLFLIRVKNVPKDVTEKGPAISYIDRYIEENRDSLRIQPLMQFFGGGAGALMMHRDLWYESRGYDEKWFGWGWNDADLKLRICLKYRAHAYGGKDAVYAYHLDHPSTAIAHDHPLNPFIVNGVYWGLAGHRLAEHPVAEPIEVPPVTEVWSGPGNWNPWLRHFLNYLKFVLTIRDYKSLLEGCHALYVMMLSLYEKNPFRQISLRLKRL